MRTNVKTKSDPIYTSEGARAARISDESQLRRLVLSCLLWEDNFYIDGKPVAALISEYAAKVEVETLAALAIEARHEQHLRHVPLFLLKSLVARASELKPAGAHIIADTVERVISRADELAEFVALVLPYLKQTKLLNGKSRKTIPSQMKHGLARAFCRFDEYSLQKYNRDAAVKLRDVLFLIHAKPRDDEQAALWKRLVDGTLATPLTWEVELSAGKDKRETFERLIRERKLGYFALLRNLRGMVEAGCDLDLIKAAILSRQGGADKILPFRFVAAARAAPQFDAELNESLMAAIGEMTVLKGRTVVLVDLSGSMNDPLSAKSDLKRVDAACALASIVPAENLRVFSFSSQIDKPGHMQTIKVIEAPARRGLAGIDAILQSHGQRGGTLLFSTVKHINETISYDRLVIITDEQAFGTSYIRGGEGDPVRAMPDPAPGTRGYVINVAVARNGVGYGKWVHLDGFSEGIIRFVHEFETLEKD